MRADAGMEYQDATERNEEIKMEQERNGETHMEHENHQYGSMT